MRGRTEIESKWGLWAGRGADHHTGAYGRALKRSWREKGRAAQPSTHRRHGPCEAGDGCARAEPPRSAWGRRANGQPATIARSQGVNERRRLQACECGVAWCGAVWWLHACGRGEDPACRGGSIQFTHQPTHRAPHTTYHGQSGREVGERVLDGGLVRLGLELEGHAQGVAVTHHHPAGTRAWIRDGKT